MFLCHKNSINDNQYKVLPQLDYRYVLVKSTDYKLISNVCPHQSSLISVNDGYGQRTCPYHNWSFDIEGNPITSGRTAYYCKNENPLAEHAVYEWNSLLFDRPVDFDITADFDDMVLMEQRVDKVNADFRIIMDIFLDVDHIQSVHSGVYDLIGIKNTDVNWKFYNKGSIQTVEQGALWISVYPYTMIEWQKGSLFITVTRPTDRGCTDVHVFKYTDKKNLNDWKLNESVWETAWLQDRKQAEIIKQFTNNNLEPQKQHFRNFLKND